MEKVLTLKDIERRKKFRTIVKRLSWYTFLSLGGVTMVIPFLWMISTSLKEPGVVFSQSITLLKDWIPSPIVWINYLETCRVIPFLRFYLNSIFVACAVTLGQVFTSALAAYAFARLRFPGRDKLFFGYLATMMVPGAVTMIPVYILLRYIGWIDTYKALTLPAIFTAYGTFMLRQFFMTVPRELEDAARIDGCSLAGIFWKIILPLSKPALATLATFVFIGNWMSFMWPLIVINSVEKNTLPIGLAYFQSVYTSDWTLLMAGSVMVTLPILVIFVLNQRFFIEGIKLSEMTGIRG